MFNSLFSKSKRTVPHKWPELIDIAQLDDLLERNDHPIAIFKHSTRCGISRMVKNGLEKEWDLPKEDVELYYLDLLQHRDVSNAIAEQTGVQHESPQLIVMKNGTVIHHASHHSISANAVREVLGA